MQINIEYLMNYISFILCVRKNIFHIFQILGWGRNTFIGYLNRENDTKEVFVPSSEEGDKENAEATTSSDKQNWLKLKDLGFIDDEEYRNRLKRELQVIDDRGFSKYFLTMKAIADKATEKMLAGPGRGSAAGSLVAYALGITQGENLFDLIKPIRQCYCQGQFTVASQSITFIGPSFFVTDQQTVSWQNIPQGSEEVGTCLLYTSPSPRDQA